MLFTQKTVVMKSRPKIKLLVSINLKYRALKSIICEEDKYKKVTKTIILYVFHSTQFKFETPVATIWPPFSFIVSNM